MVSTGANSIVGGLVGDSAGVITNSTASGVVTSTGTNSIVDDFVGANFGSIIGSVNSTRGLATSLPAFPSLAAGLPTPQVTPSLLLPFSPELLAQLSAQQAQVIRNLVGTVQLAALPTPPAVNNVQSGIRLPPQPPPSSTAWSGASLTSHRPPRPASSRTR